MLKKREWQVLGELVGFFPLVLSGEFYLGFLFVFKSKGFREVIKREGKTENQKSKSP